MARVLMFALIAALGCSSPAPRQSGQVGAGRTASAQAGTGGACTQGGCQPGLVCLATPGGYCSSHCGKTGDPCGPGTTCVGSILEGEICARACTGDQDCRAAEGYTCDPTHKVCAPPSFLAPPAPVCAATQDLPRKTFGPPQQISTAAGPGLYHSGPSAALGVKGELTTIFAAGARAGAPSVLGVANIMPDGGVDGDRELKSDRQHHADPWLASDRKGKLHAVWLGFDGGRAEQRMQVALSTSEDGRLWSAPVPAFDPADCPGDAAGCMDEPMIAIGPDKQNPRKKDAIYVFYVVRPSGQLEVVRSDDGGATFGKSVAVGGGGLGDAEVAPSGDLDVVFATDGRVEYAWSNDGAVTFSRPVTVSAPGEWVPRYFASPQVATDVKRKLIYVVYPAGTPEGKWDIQLAVSSDGGATWNRRQVNDDELCANHMLPALGLDARTGKVHLAWTENRGGVGRVVYAVCDSGAKKCSANEAVSDLPFASYGFVRHSSAWLGDHNALVLDPKRKLIHLVWTQTIEDEGGGAVARIFQATGRLR